MSDTIFIPCCYYDVTKKINKIKNEFILYRNAYKTLPLQNLRERKIYANR